MECFFIKKLKIITISHVHCSCWIQKNKLKAITIWKKHLFKTSYTGNSSLHWTEGKHSRNLKIDTQSRKMDRIDFEEPWQRINTEEIWVLGSILPLVFYMGKSENSICLHLISKPTTAFAMHPSFCSSSPSSAYLFSSCMENSLSPKKKRHLCAFLQAKKKKKKRTLNIITLFG